MHKKSKMQKKKRKAQEKKRERQKNIYKCLLFIVSTQSQITQLWQQFSLKFT